MRKLKVALLALALVGLTTSAVNAGGNAWFSLEGVVQGSASATSGPGETLVITKPLGPGTTILTIGYNVTTDSGPMAGWHIDLLDPGVGVSAANLQWVGTGYGGTTDGSNAPQLLTDFGQTSIALTGSQGLVGTFELTIVKTTNAADLREIFGTFGLGAQSDANGLWQGFVGANPFETLGNFINGFNGYDNTYIPYVGYVGRRDSVAVITIENVPEPATLALLGLGVVCLIRRRKA